MSNRSCFKDALIEANFDVGRMNIPDGPTREQIFDICDQLGITLHQAKEFYIGTRLEYYEEKQRVAAHETVFVGENETVIAICATSIKYVDHAVFTNNFKALVESGIKLDGLITF